ncbi:MAG: hypothetical protein K0B09_15225 [Bacteroidales bacterium]|nr:hypothetical protein [Bacteroidales bacterium]
MSGGLHAQILEDAAKAKAQARRAGPVPYGEFESLKNLIDSATAALFEALPATFEHRGKTYRLITDIQQAKVAIFDSPAAEKSLLVTLLCLPDEN